MNEKLISAANLDAIEDNLHYVADELSGVITNVNTVNQQINGIEENISSLNDKISDLVKNISETTIVNNAKQSIMYNNEQIEKKYGYFDIVRRRTESLLSAIDSSNISKTSLLKMKEDLLLNNPNYWLANALAALLSWIIDDKENTYKELKNAMSKNRGKTCIFFCLLNLKWGRNNVAINWLNSYLDNEDPTNLSSDFVTVLDLVSNNEFGNIGKKIIIDKINIWFNRISNNLNIETQEINKWKSHIESMEDDCINLHYLDDLSKETDILKNNLKITSSYKNILSELKYIVEKKSTNKTLDDIITSLIYDYEDEEQVFQEDNFKNRLIIENNGDYDKALEIYEKEKYVYEANVNILHLLNNIVIYNNQYKVNDVTRKLALSLIKSNIVSAYEQINNDINRNCYHIGVDDFIIEINDDVSNKYIETKTNEYIDTKFKINNKVEYIILIIANLLIFISIMFLRKIVWLVPILFVSLLFFDIYYSYKKIYKKNKLFAEQKNNVKKELFQVLERGLAESIDYKKLLKENEEHYNELKLFLDSINTKNYIKSSNERNIDIDE